MEKCLIVTNIYKTESKALGHKIAQFLHGRGIDALFYEFDGTARVVGNYFEKQDFVITLGGDCTVLFAARNCVRLGIPVFPVNLGEFGFIASIEKDAWEMPLKRFLEGCAYIEERNMIQAALISSSDRTFSGCALNDIVISAETAANAISFDVSYNCMPLGTFKADGIIASTATGSTAYSASAGGPIIDPDLDAVVLTPVNAFSLSSRPLVLSPAGEISITILPSRDKRVILTVDGQKPFLLEVGDCIKIRKIERKLKLVGCTAEQFYAALRSKLNWSGGPHA